MTGGFSQMMRVLQSLPADAPAADRFHVTLEASDAFVAECDRILEQLRAERGARNHYAAGHAVEASRETK